MKLNAWGATACVCIASMIWGAAYSVNKLCLNYGSPTEILLIQLAASVLFLVLLCVATRFGAADYRGALALWWTGLLEPGATYFFGMLGLRHSDAGVASIIISSEAVFAVIIMAALGWVSLSRSFVMVALLSTIGMYMAVIAQPAHFNDSTVSSYAFLFLSTLCAAIYLVMSARLMGKNKPLVVALMQQSVALVAMLVVYLLTPHDASATALRMPVSTVVFIAVSGIVQYGIAFSLFLVSLRFLAASRVSVYLNFTPVFGVAIGALLLGEMLSHFQILGCVIVVGALSALSFSNVTQPHGV